MSYSIEGIDDTLAVHFTTSSGESIRIGGHPSLPSAMDAVKRYQEVRRQAAAMGCRVKLDDEPMRSGGAPFEPLAAPSLEFVEFNKWLRREIEKSVYGS